MDMLTNNLHHSVLEDTCIEKGAFNSKTVGNPFACYFTQHNE